MGWIPYWNLVPLKAELKKSFGGVLHFNNGHPSVVNKWLVEAAVDAAPCSSICLVKNPQLNIAAPVGVACDGPVQSVYLGFKHDQLGFLDFLRTRHLALQDIFRQALSSHLDDPRRMSQLIWQSATADAKDVHTAAILPLNLTPNSATSVMLSRLLYRLWFGEAAGESSGTGTLQRADVRGVDLLIGDEALQRRPEYVQILDLGEVWKDLTGLPFVYAVWQSANPLSANNRRLICEAADLAQARMRVEPSVYVPDAHIAATDGSSIDLASYWKVIQYRLGPSHMRGLALFFSLARHLIQAPADGDLLVKIMRWQSAGTGVSLN
jgi:predicted solute-binding protein